jgi:hypothetical protein
MAGRQSESHSAACRPPDHRCRPDPEALQGVGYVVGEHAAVRQRYQIRHPPSIGYAGDRDDGPNRPRGDAPLPASTSRLPDSPGADPEPAP